MHTLRLLVMTKLRVIAVVLFDRSTGVRIRNLSMAAFLLVLLYASYVFFNNVIFSYVVGLEDIGYILIERLVSTGFLIFFAMLIVSSFVTALAMLFRSRETEYLFSTPVSELEVFTGKYVDILVFSSWAILVMALPILLAYANVRSFGLIEYVLTGIMVLAPYVVIATSIGTGLALVASYLSKRVSVWRQVVAGTMLFVGLLYLVVRFSRPNQMVIPFTEDFRALNIFINNISMNSHPLTPNYWLIQCLRSLVYDNYADFILYAGAMSTSALLALSLLYVVADRYFFPTWLSSTEQSMAHRSESLSGTLITGTSLMRADGSQIRALIGKDILLFLRDPSQWAQLFLVLFLLVLYFINLRFIPADIEIEQWRTIISLINLGFCGFVLATLAVRFVFPLYSLEGDAIWVLGSAPVSAYTLFRQKFWISFTAFLILTEIIALVSGTMLRLEGLYYTITVIGIFLMSASLTALAVGLGAAFPDFSEGNPSRIASSPGGILMVVCSLFYIGLMLSLAAVSGYRYTDYLVRGGGFPLMVILLSLSGALILNAVTITVPLLIGSRAIRLREY